MRSPARLLAAVPALALALAAAPGCQLDADRASGDEASPGGGGDDDSGGGLGGGAPEAGCQIAADCVPAASTCCECPTFAVPGESGFDEACSEVDCEVPAGCPLVEPACIAGACELICSPVVTDRVCDGGFARDGFGCLIDACAEKEPDPTGPECADDTGCVQVPADCCGCALGGSDTAVPAGREAEHLAGLDCDADPACPEVDVCEADAEPRCVAGRCHLVSAASGSGASLCGAPDAPPCPSGTVCVLNHPDASDATELRVGTCQAP